MKVMKWIIFNDSFKNTFLCTVFSSYWAIFVIVVVS